MEWEAWVTIPLAITPPTINLWRGCATYRPRGASAQVALWITFTETLDIRGVQRIISGKCRAWVIELEMNICVV